jgi:hypothetical protein
VCDPDCPQPAAPAAESAHSVKFSLHCYCLVAGCCRCMRTPAAHCSAVCWLG